MLSPIGQNGYVIAQWQWTDTREHCLELFLAGRSRREIARQVGIDRETINRLARRPEFQAEARRRCCDRLQDLRMRRYRQTTSLTDRISWLAEQALAKLEPDHDMDALRDARAFLHEYRALRDQERQDWHLMSVGDALVEAGSEASIDEFRTFLLKLETATGPRRERAIWQALP